jgi:hypothetical protein
VLIRAEISECGINALFAGDIICETKTISFLHTADMFRFFPDYGGSVVHVFSIQWNNGKSGKAQFGFL